MDRRGRLDRRNVTNVTRLALLAVAAGCGSAATPTSAPASGPAAARVGPGLVAGLAAAAAERAPWRCASLDAPALVAETLTVGGHTWTVAGHALTRDGAAPETLSIGVIGDAGGAAPATLAALGRLRSKLDNAKVDVVIVLGGMGSTRADIEATLGALATKAPWPAVALPGDLEPAGEQTAAITALRSHGAPVLDGRLARYVELGAASIATLPGASAGERLAAGANGCAYDAADVAALTDALSARPGLRVLATTEAPRALVAGEPTGELVLAPHAPVDVLLHGAADAPSPAATGSRDGAGRALAPGPADATGRLPGPAHPPAAGVLAIHGSAWSWRVLADAK